MGEDSRYCGRKTEIDTLLQRKFPAWFMQWHAQKHLNIYRMNSIEALARVYRNSEKLRLYGIESDTRQHSSRSIRHDRKSWSPGAVLDATRRAYAAVVQ